MNSISSKTYGSGVRIACPGYGSGPYIFSHISTWSSTYISLLFPTTFSHISTYFHYISTFPYISTYMFHSLLLLNAFKHFYWPYLGQILLVDSPSRGRCIRSFLAFAPARSSPPSAPRPFSSAAPNGELRNLGRPQWHCSWRDGISRYIYIYIFIYIYIIPSSKGV